MLNNHCVHLVVLKAAMHHVHSQMLRLLQRFANDTYCHPVTCDSKIDPVSSCATDVKRVQQLGILITNIYNVICVVGSFVKHLIIYAL